MKKLTRIHLPLVIAVMAVFAVATPAQNLVSNLPDSDAVITINLRRIFSETLPRVLPAEQMTSFQASLAKAKQIAGFDVNNIDSAIVGLRFSRSAPLSTPHILFEMHGTFNADALISLLKIGMAGKTHDEKYGTKTLTLMKLSDLMSGGKSPLPMSPGMDIAIVALDGGTLAGGSVDYIKAQLDASTGQNRIKPELTQLIARDPSALISFAGLIPQGFFSSLMPQNAQGNEEIIRLVNSLQQIYLSVNMDAQSFPIALMLKSSTAENARSIAGLLQTLVQMGSGSVTDKNLKAIMEALKVNAQDTEIQVTTSLPQETVASFVRSMFKPKATEQKADTKTDTKTDTKKP